MNQLSNLPKQNSMSLIGAAAIGAGASLVGGLFNRGSQSATNRMNYKIAQMNNEWNEKMMEKQMAYNTDMWNKENEYNSAANQVKRLKEAGLNPYLSLGNAGQAGSVGSVTPPQAQPVQMQAPQFDASGFAQHMSEFAALSLQKKKVDEEVRTMQIDNMTRAQKNLAELYKIQESTRSEKEKADTQAIINRWQDKLLSLDYQQKQNQIESTKQDVQLKMNQNLMMSKELAIFDQQKQLEMANLVSSTLLNNAQRFAAHTQGRLNQREAEKVKAETAKVVAEHLLVNAKEMGQHISNEVAARSADALVFRAYSEMYGNPNPIVVGLHGAGFFTDSPKYR